MKLFLSTLSALLAISVVSVVLGEYSTLEDRLCSPDESHCGERESRQGVSSLVAGVAMASLFARHNLPTEESYQIETQKSTRIGMNNNP